MIELPHEFPLPEERFQRQRSLLTAHVEVARRSPRHARRRIAAVAVVILVGGLLVAPALGIGGRLLDLIQGSPRPPDVASPVWSPDGRTIAFMRPAKRGSYLFAVYVVNADGRNQRKLSPDSAYDSGPRWSPQWRRLLVTRRRDSQISDIWVMNADGSGQRNLTRSPSEDFGPVWSPDGDMIAFVREGEICVITPTAAGSGTSRRARGLPALRRGPPTGGRSPSPVRASVAPATWTSTS